MSSDNNDIKRDFDQKYEEEEDELSTVIKKIVRTDHPLRLEDCSVEYKKKNVNILKLNRNLLHWWHEEHIENICVPVECEEKGLDYTKYSAKYNAQGIYSMLDKMHDACDAEGGREAVDFLKLAVITWLDGTVVTRDARLAKMKEGQDPLKEDTYDEERYYKDNVALESTNSAQ